MTGRMKKINFVVPLGKQDLTSPSPVKEHVPQWYRDGETYDNKGNTKRQRIARSWTRQTCTCAALCGASVGLHPGPMDAWLWCVGKAHM